MICSGCAKEVSRVTTAVINGNFGVYCPNCIQGDKRHTSPGHAQYSRDRDREDNAGDLLQPRNHAGQPNREFIKQYPQESKELFSEKELKDNG